MRLIAVRTSLSTGTREVSSMNPQFWFYWIGIVTVGYIILLPGIIFLVMKRAQERQGA